MLIKYTPRSVFYKCVSITMVVCLAGVLMLSLVAQVNKPAPGTPPKEALTPEMYARIAGSVDQLAQMERQLASFGVQHHEMRYEIAGQREQLTVMNAFNALIAQKLAEFDKRLDSYHAQISSLSPVASNERLARIEVFISNYEKDQQRKEQRQDFWLKLIFGTIMGAISSAAINEFFKRRRNIKRWTEQGYQNGNHS